VSRNALRYTLQETPLKVEEKATVDVVKNTREYLILKDAIATLQATTTSSESVSAISGEEIIDKRQQSWSTFMLLTYLDAYERYFYFFKRARIAKKPKETVKNEIHKEAVATLQWLFNHIQTRICRSYRVEQALPLQFTQSVLYAVESISHLLVASLREDSSGYCQHSIIATVDSLIRLQLQIQSYSRTIALMSFVAVFQDERGRERHIRYKVGTLGHLSEGVRMLFLTVEASLEMLMREYGDVLEQHKRALSVAHCLFLEEKLANMAKK
jgi:hypothetical protein